MCGYSGVYTPIACGSYSGRFRSTTARHATPGALRTVRRSLVVMAGRTYASIEIPHEVTHFKIRVVLPEG